MKCYIANKQVWIFQPGSSQDKRQATLQLCIRPEGEQTVKPAIIFRGKGNVPTEERLKHDEDVHVSLCTSASSPGKNRGERSLCHADANRVLHRGWFPRKVGGKLLIGCYVDVMTNALSYVVIGELMVFFFFSGEEADAHRLC